MHFIILILSIVFFIQPSFSAPASKKVTCPEDGIGAKKGDAPLLSSKTPKGSLIVCGYHEEGFYSEFDIYSEANGKYSKSLYRAHAMQFFKIEPFEGGFNLTEFIYFRDKQVPFQKLAMNCNIGDTCSISRATCEKEGFVPFKTDILKRIKPYYKNGKNLTEPMIRELADLALSGNQDAVSIFKNNPGLALDGAVSEIYNETKEQLNHPCFRN